MRMNTCSFFSTKGKYGSMIFLIGGFFFVELVVGIISESLALQTDAFHMLSDLLALIIGLTAHLLAQKEKDLRYTYGWIRAEIIGSLINSVFLLALSFTIFIEVIEKFIELSTKNGEEAQQKLAQEIDLVLIVAGIGLFINLIGLVLFGHHHNHTGGQIEIVGDEDEASFESFDSLSLSSSNSDMVQQLGLSLNDHAVCLHVFGDALGSIVVIITGLIIKFSEGEWRFWLDPVASFFLVLFIGYNSIKLLIKSGKILLHQSLENGQELLNEISNVTGVSEVHEFHIWPLTETIQVATLHIRLDIESGHLSTDKIIKKINKIVHRYGIHSCTIQPEFDECLEYLCKNNCKDLQCC